MKLPSFLYVFLMLSFLAVPSYAQKKKKKHKKEKHQNKEVSAKKKVKEPSEKDLINAEFIYLTGMKFYILDNYKDALSSFKTSLKLNPKAIATHYKLADCYLQLDKLEEAEKEAIKTLELDNTNEYYHLMLINIYKKQKKYENLTTAYSDLLKVKKRENYYFDWATSYIYLSKPEKSLEVYDKYETRFGVSEFAIQQKQRIYRLLGQDEKLLFEGQKLVDNFPNEMQYLMNQVKDLLHYKRESEAKKLLKTTLERNVVFSKSPELILLNAIILKKEGDFELYQKEMKKAFTFKELSLKSRLEILMSLKLSQDLALGTELAKNTITHFPSSSRANLMYGDFMKAARNNAEARDYYLKAVNLNGNRLQVWLQVIQYDWELNQIDSMLKHSESALEMFPNQPSLYYYNGMANYIGKDYEEAKLALEYGKKIVGNPQTLSQFNSQLGDIYNQLKEYQKSDAAYESVLSFDSKNIYVLNNYSYFLSLRKDKLEKAVLMCKRLVLLMPNQATYLDTYAWVLFVKGDYKEAKKLLKQAVQTSDDATIVEHYGDVLFKLGENDKALIQWKKALDSGADNPAKLKIKIADKKL